MLLKDIQHAICTGRPEAAVIIEVEEADGSLRRFDVVAVTFSQNAISHHPGMVEDAAFTFHGSERMKRQARHETR